ncbi:MAG: GLUG motif-containing protein [archaeon]|nr:GLUG motif-containing protein [archaeon]
MAGGGGGFAFEKFTAKLFKPLKGLVYSFFSMENNEKLILFIGFAGLFIGMIYFNTPLGSTGKALNPVSPLTSPETSNFGEVRNIPPPIKICTLQDLDNIREKLDGNYIQVCDIDLDGYYFRPIGDEDARFKGTFNGNGYTLYNFEYLNRSDSYVGFFGLITEPAEIINVKLENVNIQGNSKVGGLIGGIEGGHIKDSYARGSVTGEYYVGGLVGFLADGDVENSRYEGLVNGSRDAVGGLIGSSLASNNLIMNSSSTGNVTGKSQVGGLVGFLGGSIIENSYFTGTVNGESMTGGLVGFSAGNTIENSYSLSEVDGEGAFVGGLVGFLVDGDVKNSYSSSEVRGEEHSVGGLVGFSKESIIENSYSEGEITGGSQVGGLIGYSEQLNMKNSYSSGKVKGGANVGGLIGGLAINDGLVIITNSYSSSEVRGESVGGLISGIYTLDGLIILENTYSNGFVSSKPGFSSGGLIRSIGIEGDGNVTIAKSYWDIDTSGQSESAGGEGRTKDKMTSVPRPLDTYQKWNFENIWDQTNDNYPRLRGV